jgi:formaldehyde-activating enzyme involved in methanogenesis
MLSRSKGKNAATINHPIAKVGSPTSTAATAATTTQGRLRHPLLETTTPPSKTLRPESMLGAQHRVQHNDEARRVHGAAPPLA